MPTYDYVCDFCGISFERIQLMSDKILRKCPDCGVRKLRRLIGSGAAVIFKGAGFYETDYKRKSGKPEKDAEKTESKTESSSASSSGDSKTDRKSKDTDSSASKSKD